MRAQEEKFIFDLMLQALKKYGVMIKDTASATCDEDTKVDLQSIAQDMQQLIEATEAEKKNSKSG